MDTQTPSPAHGPKIRGITYVLLASLVIGGAAFGLSRLRRPLPSVERSTLVTAQVKRGSLPRVVRGSGVLVPEDMQWIPAQSDARVERILKRPGAVVQPDTIILELDDPQLQREALDAEYQLKAAQADYENLKVQLNSELLNQKALAAAVQSDYEQAKIQHEVDEKLLEQGLGSDITAKLSKVKEQQLAIRAQLEQDRTKIALDSNQARLAAQQARIEQQRALYQLRLTQVDSLHVRAGISGVLQSVTVEEGQQVTPGMNLARVANPRKLEAEIKIPEAQAKDVAIGQKVLIALNNDVVGAHVSRMDPAVQNGTVAVDVLPDGPWPKGARPDLSVNGTIQIETLKNALYLHWPAQAPENTTAELFKISDDGLRAVRVSVELGPSSANSVEVLRGLNAGDKVILSDMSAWDKFGQIQLK